MSEKTVVLCKFKAKLVQKQYFKAEVEQINKITLLSAISGK